MKKILMATVLATISVAASAETKTNATGKVRRPMREVIAERRAKAGGMIEAPVTGKVVRVVNAQKIVKTEELNAIIGKIRDLARLPIVLEDGKAVDYAAMRDSTEGAVMLLTDDPKYPTILVAPENAWSAVGVAKLASDEPDARRLSERMEKEMWRALCMSLGSANAIFQPCLLRTIRTLKQLDYCANKVPSPEPLGKLEDAAKEFGVLRLRSVTYKNACFEGWAPAPTSEVQKAIYEGVKNGTIKPYVPAK